MLIDDQPTPPPEHPTASYQRLTLLVSSDDAAWIAKAVASVRARAGDPELCEGVALAMIAEVWVRGEELHGK